MRRPILAGLAVIAVLVVLGSPFLRVNFGLSGAESLPRGAQSRIVTEALLHDFKGDTGSSFAVVINGISDPRDRLGALATFAAQVSGLTGVARVDALADTYSAGRQVAAPTPQSASMARPTGTWLTVTPTVDQQSNAGQHLIAQIRRLPAPFRFGVEGDGATPTDTKAAIFSRLPYAFGIIALVTFVLLFLLFNSLLVPIKAIVLNLLSLTATFGRWYGSSRKDTSPACSTSPRPAAWT